MDLNLSLDVSVSPQSKYPAEEGGGMPAYFAFLTVLSLHVFVCEGVDVAIMEVGIGGQYDRSVGHV